MSAIHQNALSGMLARNALSQSPTEPDALVRTHMRLVESIARNIHRRMSASMAMEDLMQIGMMALVEASRVFEPRGVAQFSTYASYRIRGAIIDELRRQATISRQALRDRRAFAAVTDKLSCQLGRQPSDGDMAQALCIEVTAYRKAAAATATLRFQSFDVSGSENSSWFVDQTPNALDALEHDHLRVAIEVAVDELPEIEGKVLQLYFIEEMSLSDIGDLLGVSGPRVCQIKKKAVEKLRQKLTGWA